MLHVKCYLAEGLAERFGGKGIVFLFPVFNYWKRGGSPRNFVVDGISIVALLIVFVDSGGSPRNFIVDGIRIVSRFVIGWSFFVTRFQFVMLFVCFVFGNSNSSKLHQTIIINVVEEAQDPSETLQAALGFHPDNIWPEFDMF